MCKGEVYLPLLCMCFPCRQCVKLHFNPSVFGEKDGVFRTQTPPHFLFVVKFCAYVKEAHEHACLAVLSICNGAGGFEVTVPSSPKTSNSDTY